MVLRGMSSRLASVLLCLLRGLVAGDDPVQAGQSGYWVKLRSLSTSEGQMEPAFDQDGSDFTVEVQSMVIDSLSITFELDMSKYDPAQTPNIFINDEEYAYSPGDAMTYTVHFDDPIAPVDKFCDIKVADPLGPTGFPFSHETAHTYRVHVKRPPNFEEAIDAVGLQVLGENGDEIDADRAFQPKMTKYNYVVPDGQSHVSLQMSCSSVATKMKYDGAEAELDSVHIVQLSSGVTEVNVQCIYDDPKWTADVQEKTYALSFEQHSVPVDEESLSVELMLPAEQGYCAMRDGEDTGGMTGFVCRSGVLDPGFSGRVNNPALGLYLVRDETGESTTLSQTPVAVTIPEKASSAYTLKVLGSDPPLEYPVKVVHAAACEFACPADTLPKSDVYTGSLAHYLCSAETCAEEDEARCCKESPPCTSIEGITDLECPPGKVLSLKETCGHDPCSYADTDHCCVKDNIGRTPEKETFTYVDERSANWERNEASGEFEYVGRHKGSYRHETFHYAGKGGGDFQLHKDGAFHLVPAGHGDFLQAQFKHVGKGKGEYNQRHDGAFHRVTGGSYIRWKAFYNYVGHNHGNFVRDTKGDFDNVGSNHGSYLKIRGNKKNKEDSAVKTIEMQGEIHQKVEEYRHVGCGPRAAEVCLGQMCVYDKGCLKRNPSHSGLGCFAGGISPACRYCGFGKYPKCPVSYDCEGACHHWSTAQHVWCHKHYDVKCPKYVHHVELWSTAKLSKILGQGTAATAAFAGLVAMAALTAVAMVCRISGRASRQWHDPKDGPRRVELMPLEEVSQAPLVE